jgi:nitrate/nitrite-specific signal transduction histidine kinase
LHVKIRDYGIGFEDGNKKENHFGLSMMQERAKIIHAVFQIHSVINEGTEITIQVAADE